MRRAVLSITIVLAIALNIVALYAGIYLYVFTFWTLQDGDAIDWPAKIFFWIAFANILCLTILLVRKLIAAYRRPQRPTTNPT